ncbi:MAG: hypothetical protein VXZ39_04560 [Planctomycetota bacterium]|nr:hypothetical protein [Planctomycetota bacterium]MEC8511541.1 hypothetical protein [Planctomycetota bacterium]
MTSAPITARPLGLAAVLLSACTSTDRVPDRLLALLDDARAGGAVEIELDRDGAFRDLEAEISIERVPVPIVSALVTAFPGAHITGAEREWQDGAWTFELGLLVDGRALQAVLDEDGRLLETEEPVPLVDAPASVVAASMVLLPASTLVSVDRVEGPEGVRYHVKRVREGARYKVVTRADGAVLRAVREIPAEIEIPLLAD